MEQSYWSQFAKPLCYPKCNCEALRDGWVVQPSATWSSLPLLFLGFWMLKKAWKVDPRLVMQGFSVVFLGLASTLAHGTFTAVALHLDFLAIILCLTWLGMYCLERPFNLRWIFLWLMITNLIFIFVTYFETYRIIFCCLYFCCIFFLWLKWMKKNSSFKKYFYVSFFVMAVAALLFFLDEKKIWCVDPYSWFLGHSLWHLGVCFGLAYSFIGFCKLYKKPS